MFDIWIFLFVVFGGFWLVGVYDWVVGFKDKSFCLVMGWHDGSGGKRSFDGCSIHATCSRCGKEVMQDSQGNWF